MRTVFIKGSCHYGETGVHKVGSLFLACPSAMSCHGLAGAPPPTLLLCSSMSQIQNYELNKMFVCNFFSLWSLVTATEKN